MITLLPPPAKPIRMSGRVLKPEMLQSADRALADRNLRDMVDINRWFGGHRALLSVMSELAPRGKQFSVLDVGAASISCSARRFCITFASMLDSTARQVLQYVTDQIMTSALQLLILRALFWLPSTVGNRTETLPVYIAEVHRVLP